ncbi:MAG: TetR/AcrR family transcriptional regulator [Candidatus Dormibacterales bacterium]
MRVASRLLASEGRAALTMRRIASELGIQAPSLYKHFHDKRALEAALIADGLRELGSAMGAALLDGAEPVEAVAGAYRRFGLQHSHLYRLMNDGPLPRDLLPPGLEDDVSRPLVEIFGDRVRARVAWAAAHGLVSLELAGRFPADADIDAAWDSAVRTLRASAGG